MLCREAIKIPSESKIFALTNAQQLTQGTVTTVSKLLKILRLDPVRYGVASGTSRIPIKSALHLLVSHLLVPITEYRDDREETSKEA